VKCRYPYAHVRGESPGLRLAIDLDAAQRSGVVAGRGENAGNALDRAQVGVVKSVIAIDRNRTRIEGSRGGQRADMASRVNRPNRLALTISTEKAAGPPLPSGMTVIFFSSKSSGTLAGLLGPDDVR